MSRCFFVLEKQSAGFPYDWRRVCVSESYKEVMSIKDKNCRGNPHDPPDGYERPEKLEYRIIVAYEKGSFTI